MKIKTSELTGAALDYAVAECEGRREPELLQDFKTAWYTWGNTHYSTSWQQGGPIIEREKIAIDWDHDCWNASTDSHPAYYSAETPLVAAMRCYVASKLGDEVVLLESEV